MSQLFRRRYTATPDAVPQARHDVLDTLTQAGLVDPILRANVALAVSEAASNAVRHAYPPDHADGPVEVAVTREPDSLTATVSDEGLGMDNRPPTEGGGLGLVLMRDQSHGLLLKSDEAGTTVKLRFAI